MKREEKMLAGCKKKLGVDQYGIHEPAILCSFKSWIIKDFKGSPQKYLLLIKEV